MAVSSFLFVSDIELSIFETSKTLRTPYMCKKGRFVPAILIFFCMLILSSILRKGIASTCMKGGIAGMRILHAHGPKSEGDHQPGIKYKGLYIIVRYSEDAW